MGIMIINKHILEIWENMLIYTSHPTFGKLMDFVLGLYAFYKIVKESFLDLVMIYTDSVYSMNSYK